MAIITFWSDSKKEVGQTATAIAVATQMAIQHSYKVLLISTYNNDELDRAFLQSSKESKGIGHILDGTKKVNIDSGIMGLQKVVTSSKLTPEMIPNYTKIIFGNSRLEILSGYNGNQKDYDDIFNLYPNIVLNASLYYDLVIVDLNRDKAIDQNIQQILEASNVIMYGLNQNNANVDMLKQSELLKVMKQKILPYFGRYDRFSKYNVKNIARFLKYKRDLNFLSYNTLFNEACYEGTVAGLFIKLSGLSTWDKNTKFYSEVGEISESIIYKIQELGLKL